MIKWLKYSGLLTVLILWISQLLAINQINFNIFGRAPLSSLGVNAESAPYFSVGLLLAVITLGLFALYLNQHYTLTRSFWIFLAIGQLGQVVAAIIPYGGDQPSKAIHTIGALTLAFSIPFLLWRFATAQNGEATRKTAYLFVWAELVAFVVGIGMFIFVFKGAPFGQVLPALVFHSWLIYYSFSKQHGKSEII